MTKKPFQRPEYIYIFFCFSLINLSVKEFFFVSAGTERTENRNWQLGKPLLSLNFTLSNPTWYLLKRPKNCHGVCTGSSRLQRAFHFFLLQDTDKLSRFQRTWLTEVSLICVWLLGSTRLKPFKIIFYCALIFQNKHNMDNNKISNLDFWLMIKVLLLFPVVVFLL